MASSFPGEHSIYVDPNHWGEGVRRTLVDSVHRELAELGFTDTVLLGASGDHRARPF